MAAEMCVTIKNDESRKTLKTYHLVYAPMQVSEDDPIIKDAVEQTIKEFGEQPDKIKVRINLEIK